MTAVVVRPPSTSSTLQWTNAAQARVSAGGRLYLSGLEPSLTDYLDAQALLVKGRGG